MCWDADYSKYASPTYCGEGEGGPVEAVDVLSEQVWVTLEYAKSIFST